MKKGQSKSFLVFFFFIVIISLLIVSIFLFTKTKSIIGKSIMDIQYEKILCANLDFKDNKRYAILKENGEWIKNLDKCIEDCSNHCQGINKNYYDSEVIGNRYKNSGICNAGGCLPSPTELNGNCFNCLCFCE